MVAGNIESDTIMSYTVIGDAVNLGARLESLNKEFGTRIIISESTRAELKGRYDIHPLGEVVVKGKRNRSRFLRSNQHEAQPCTSWSSAESSLSEHALPCRSQAEQIGGISKGLGIAKKAKDVSGAADDRCRRTALGENVSEKIRTRYGVVQDAGVHRYVDWLGRCSRRPARVRTLPWTFIVLDTDGVNAFAAPGGYVHITRGAMALIKNEAELAGVLGHEIIHVTEKHTVRAIQKNQAVQMGAAETLSGSAALMNRVVAAVYENIVERGFGRGEENESDEQGVALANKVGYAPNGLVTFLTTLKDRNKKSKEKRGLFASHPEMQEPLDRITKQIASKKLTATATVETRYTKIVTYKPVPVTAIATVNPGAAGLTGGDAKAEEKKAEEKKAEEPKKSSSA